MSFETRWRKRMEASMDESRRAAIEALAKYKFWMFGYWAAAWVRDNRLSGLKRPSPFKIFVDVARAVLRGDTVEIHHGPIAPSRRPAHAQEAHRHSSR